MQQSSHALHYLTISADKTISSTAFGQFTFDPYNFSRVKYGDGRMVKVYAQKLVELLIAEQLITKDQEYFLCSSAYQNVPTAAAAIADHMPALLRDAGYKITEFKINGQAFSADFSNQNESQRKATLAKIKLTLPADIQKAIRHQQVIAIDDIKVTGLHESALAGLFAEHDVANTLFCYVAALEQEGSIWWPEVEWELNHCYINGLSRLSELMRDSSFIPNSRVCKFILQQPAEDVEPFLSQVPPETLRAILRLMRADNYHLMSELSQNYNTIEHFIYAEAHR
jgi:hypothetical protein